jgi:hypothetical protein
MIRVLATSTGEVKTVATNPATNEQMKCVTKLSFTHKHTHTHTERVRKNQTFDFMDQYPIVK